MGAERLMGIHYLRLCKCWKRKSWKIRNFGKSPALLGSVENCPGISHFIQILPNGLIAQLDMNLDTHEEEDNRDFWDVAFEHQSPKVPNLA